MGSPPPPDSPPPPQPVVEFLLESVQDPGRALMEGFIKELLRRMSDPQIAAEMSASELELVRKVCSDNSLSLSSIRKGDFGETAKRVAEEFPFPEGPREGAPLQ